MRALKAVRQHYRNYHLKSGVFHFYRGEHGPAAEYLTRAVTEESDTGGAERRAALYYLVQTRIGAATEHEANDEPDRAAREYERALEVMPAYPDVHYRLGMVFRRQENLSGAATHLEKAVAGNPLFVEALVELGFLSLDLSREELAADCFERAAAARSKRVSAKITAAKAALSRGERNVAHDMYADAFLSDLSAFQKVFEAGLAHLRAERWDDAAENLREASALCPRFADVQNYLGVALAESSHGPEAMLAFRRSLEINPDYLVAWLNLAYVALDVGDLPSSRAALDEFFSREPEDAPAERLREELERREPPIGARPPATAAAQENR